MLTQRKIRVWTSAILVLLPLAAWAQSIDPVQILLRSQTGKYIYLYVVCSQRNFS